jgi:hypothetical protein
LMTEDTWFYRSPSGMFRSFVRWTPTIASNSTVPSILSSADWNDSMSWPHSRHTIAESSSSSRIRLSILFHFRSSKRRLIRSLELQSLSDVLTVLLIKNRLSMSLRLPE